MAVAQLAERRAYDAEAAGSNPARHIFRDKRFLFIAMSEHAMDMIRSQIVPEETIGGPSGNTENYTDTPQHLKDETFLLIQKDILSKIHAEIESTFVDETTINELVAQQADFKWAEWQVLGTTRLLNAYATRHQIREFDLWFLTKKRLVEAVFAELEALADGFTEEDKNQPYRAGHLRDELLQSTTRFITHNLQTARSQGQLDRQRLDRQRRAIHHQEQNPQPVPHCSDPRRAAPEGPTLDEGGDPRPLGDRVDIHHWDNGAGSTFTRYALRMPPAMLRIATHSRSVR